MSIVDVFNSLSNDQRKQLMYAFENGRELIVRLEDKFIGVNVDHISHLDIVQRSGSWSVGYDRSVRA